MNLNSLPNLAITGIATEGSEENNVAQWFKKSLSGGDFLAVATRIQCNLAEQVVDPTTEPKFTILSIVRKFIDQKSLPIRVFLESQSQTWGISFDIMSVKLSPADLIDDTLIDDKTVDLKAPLLMCRYRIFRQSDGIVPMQTLMDSFKEYDEEHRKMTKPDVKLDSSINFILDLLDKNSALLSTEYVNEWKATSTFNESGFFKPSFLVPLPCKQTVKAKEIALFCAFPSCGKKWSKVCAGCKAAHYCSAECQKQHWKVHKKVCGKKANELESTANSVIVSLETLSPTQLAVQQRFPGEKMCSFSTSHIGGPTNTQTAKDLRRNVHGDERFVVKIQVQLTEGSMFGLGLILNPQGEMMVYDEKKSFQIQIANNEQPAHGKIFELISTKGVPCPNLRGNARGKGYLYAKREGMNLRLFIDTIAPQQPW